MSDSTDANIGGVALRMWGLMSPGSPCLLVLPDSDWPDERHVALLQSRLAKHSLAAVMPRLPGLWWLSRPEPGTPFETSPLAFLAETVVPWMQSELAPAAIGVLGVGRGGQGAMQLAYRWPRAVPVVAAVAPLIDFHLLQRDDPVLVDVFPNSEAARQETATLHLHPLNWPPHQWFAADPVDWDAFIGCDRLASKLSSIGIPFTSVLRDSTGGDRERYRSEILPRAVEFLAARLSEVVQGAAR
ncbi:MAG: hypothetical protein KF774_15995 [Planctomyces sp.]|nr:hypothetical protein [Planctomyces sp.]